MAPSHTKLFDQLALSHRARAARGGASRVRAWEKKTGLSLPADLAAFYARFDGARLFGDALTIVPLAKLRRARVVVARKDDDLTAPSSWYAIAEADDGEWLAIDLAPPRARPYIVDCFHETFGRRGKGLSPIVARSFEDFVRRVLASGGKPYWLAPKFRALGDAMAGRPPPRSTPATQLFAKVERASSAYVSLTVHRDSRHPLGLYLHEGAVHLKAIVLQGKKLRPILVLDWIPCPTRDWRQLAGTTFEVGKRGFAPVLHLQDERWQSQRLKATAGTMKFGPRRKHAFETHFELTVPVPRLGPKIVRGVARLDVDDVLYREKKSTPPAEVMRVLSRFVDPRAHKALQPPDDVGPEWSLPLKP